MNLLLFVCLFSLRENIMQSSNISEKEEGILMEVQVVEVIDHNLEFWPLQHPMEPDHQDHPVICPMPNSTSLLHEGTMLNNKRTPESWRKRTEVSREVKASAETAVRLVRKRHHHTLSRPDHPIVAMSPLPPLPTTQNIPIFQILQQLDKFESS